MTRLPLPPEAPSILATETLNTFERVINAPVKARPSDAPDWAKDGVYKIDEVQIYPTAIGDIFPGLEEVMPTIPLDYESPDSRIWVPSGFLWTSTAGYVIPRPDKLRYLFGRLRNEGDSDDQAETVIYACTKIGDVESDDFYIESIAHQIERFIEVAGWLKRIDRANQALAQQQAARETA